MPAITTTPFGSPAPTQTFMGLPAASLDAPAGDVVILGAPSATPYAEPYSAGAPAAIRRAIARYAASRHHMDFDLGHALEPDGGPAARIVDAGDLAWHKTDFAKNRDTIRAAVGKVLAAGAVPVVLGGDDSIPIPVLAAYEGHGPIAILQIDAHIDWREEVGGERFGLSSTMRRAAEMRHVQSIVQVGQRAIGSARPGDAEDARRRGVRFVTAREAHRDGVEAALAHVPAGVRVFVNFDVDVLDPSVMPAVYAPSPGGLMHWQALDLLHGLAAKARIAGFSIVELIPDKDPTGLCALTAARLVVNVLGLCRQQLAVGASLARRDV